MRTLPAIAPDLGTWHRVIVHSDCHVQFAHVLYSAPFGLVGKRLWLRVTDGTALIRWGVDSLMSNSVIGVRW